MSFWKRIKEKGFSFKFLTIKFSTSGKGIKIHSVKIPIVGEIGKKEEKKDEQT